MAKMEDLSTTPHHAVALFTYSTKPRGGVIHTLSLGEQLQALGHRVHVFALQKDEETRFFRPTSVPYTLIPCAPAPQDEPLADRIQRYIDTYYDFLVSQRQHGFDVYHAQDCISANALWRLRTEGRIQWYVRTVHHVDDFKSPSLIECQYRSITEPEYRIVVSRYWQRRLADEFGVETTVIHNGVDVERFQPPNSAERAAARSALGVDDRMVFLHVGGIEPRKNSIRVLRAFHEAHRALAARGCTAVLVLAGGETLFDYRAYREEFFQVLAGLDLVPDDDVRLLGVVDDATLCNLYRAADVFTFPSVKEGWGLVVLEAMASGLPVLASDIAVFREYLHPDENAVLVNPRDEEEIAGAMLRLAEDGELRQRLARAGRATAKIFSWTATARAHVAYYKSLGESG